jgi:hypothetical protein
VAAPAAAVDPTHPDASLLALGAGWNAAVEAYSMVFGVRGAGEENESATEIMEREVARLNSIGVSILSQRARTPEGVVFKCRVLAYCRGDTARTARQSAERAFAENWLSDMTAVDAIVADVLSL